MSWNLVNFQSCFTAPKRGNSRRKKMRCSKLVNGRWNGEYCMFCWATGWRILKWERTNTKDIVAVSQSQVEMGMPCGKNGPAQVGKHYVTVICKTRWTTGRLKTWCADRSKRVTRGQRSRTAKNRNEWNRYDFRKKATSPGIPHLVIRHSNSVVPPGGRCRFGIN